MLVMVLTSCTTSEPEQILETPTVTATVTLTPEPTHTPTITPTLPPEVRLDEGDQAIFMGDYDRALTIFRETLSQGNDEALIAKSNLGIGQAYLLKGNPSSGLNNLRAAAGATDPIIAARANYFLGQTYTQLQRYQDALDSYQVYLTLRPDLIDTHIHEKRGDLYHTLRDYEQAIASYQLASETGPPGGSEGVLIKIGRAYQAKEDLETALALYQEINQSSESDFTRAQMDLLIGQIYQELEQPEQAYAYFQNAVDNYPFAYDARTALVILVNAGVPVNEYQRGLINYNFGNHILAIEAFDRYLAQMPESMADAALYYRGLAIRSAGVVSGEPRHEEAIAQWQALIEGYPASPYYVDAWQSIEFTQWAFMNDPQASAETSLAYVAQRPDTPVAPEFLFRAGRSFERADMLLAAANTWARIANEYPESEYTFQAVFFAGIAHVRLDEWADAQAVFSRALVLASQPSEVAASHLWIGKCQEAQGDISIALDSWKLAQTANPFGHYSIRAEDLLIGRDMFTDPDTFDLDPDLEPFRAEAENWLKATFDLPLDTNLESPGMLVYDMRYQRGLEFWALGDYERAKAEFESMRIEFAQEPAQTFRLIPALVDIGLYRSALIASSQILRLAGLEGGDALTGPKFFSRIRFGAYYLDWLLPVAESEGISPLLVLATMRQESAYEGFIRSVAGARGLMQIMPDTGAQLAAEMSWPGDYSVGDLDRPHVSLIFGTRYLRKQRQLFDGDLFAMLAAYNGGPGNTIVWKGLMPFDDPDLFVEVVRIEETRNYIRLINEIHYIYRWLYGSPMEP